MKDDLIIIDGCTIYILDDYVYIDNSSYSHFYDINDIKKVFNYYKKIQTSLNKKIIFEFFDSYFVLDNDTTLENIRDEFNNININKEDIVNNQYENMKLNNNKNILIDNINSEKIEILKEKIKRNIKI